MKMIGCSSTAVDKDMAGLIKDLADYLIKKGWDKAVSTNIAKAYYNGHLDGAEAYAETINSSDEYVDKVTQDIVDWTNQ